MQLQLFLPAESSYLLFHDLQEEAERQASRRVSRKVYGSTIYLSYYDLVTFFPPSAEGEPTSFYWKKKANMWLSQNDAALAAVVQQFLLLDFSF